VGSSRADTLGNAEISLSIFIVPPLIHMLS
jgi:hypothetical protein